MRWRADQIVWDISFYKALHDWEQGIISNNRLPFSDLFYLLEANKNQALLSQVIL